MHPLEDVMILQTCATDDLRGFLSVAVNVCVSHSLPKAHFRIEDEKSSPPSSSLPNAILIRYQHRPQFNHIRDLDIMCFPCCWPFHDIYVEEAPPPKKKDEEKKEWIMVEPGAVFYPENVSQKHFSI